MSAFKRLQIPTRRPWAASNSSSSGVVNDKQCSFDRPGMLTKSGLIETRMWLECGVDSTRSHGGLKNLPRFPSNWIFLPLRHVSKGLQQSSFGLDDRPQILGCEPVDASDWNTNTCPLDCAFFYRTLRVMWLLFVYCCLKISLGLQVSHLMHRVLLHRKSSEIKRKKRRRSERLQQEKKYYPLKGKFTPGILDWSSLG